MGCARTDWSRFATTQLLMGGSAADEAAAAELVCWLALPRASQQADFRDARRWLMEHALPAVRRAAAACGGGGAPHPWLDSLWDASQPGAHRGVFVRLLLAATTVATCPSSWMVLAVQFARRQLAQAPSPVAAGGGATAPEDEQRAAAELMGWVWWWLELARGGAALADEAPDASAAHRRRVAAAALEQGAKLAESATAAPHADDAAHALRRARRAALGSHAGLEAEGSRHTKPAGLGPR